MSASPFMWSATVTYEDWLVGAFDEIDIEARLWEMRGKAEATIAHAEREVHRAALRRIDRLKIAGAYEAERSACRALVDLDPTMKAVREFQDQIGPAEKVEMDRRARDVDNFLAGLRSPDDAQRKRFQAVYDEIEMAGKAAPQTAAVIAIVERVKGKGGRPPLIPIWRDVVWQLDRMRDLIVSGMTIPAAARRLADEEGRVNKTSRAELFEMRYRERLDLRN